MAEQNSWWGYKHTNGSFHVKRFFDQRDIQEALESPFVENVTGTFPAKDREEAMTITVSKL